MVIVTSRGWHSNTNTDTTVSSRVYIPCTQSIDHLLTCSNYHVYCCCSTDDKKQCLVFQVLVLANSGQWIYMFRCLVYYYYMCTKTKVRVETPPTTHHTETPSVLPSAHVFSVPQHHICPTIYLEDSVAFCVCVALTISLLRTTAGANKLMFFLRMVLFSAFSDTRDADFIRFS